MAAQQPTDPLASAYSTAARSTSIARWMAARIRATLASPFSFALATTWRTMLSRSTWGSGFRTRVRRTR